MCKQNDLSQSILKWYEITHILVFILLLSFIFLAVPTADDYSYAVCSQVHESFGSTTDYFNEWSGRYSTILINNLWYNGLNGINMPYWFGLFINITIFFLGIHLLIQYIIPRKISKTYIWLITFFIFTGIIRGLPTLDESIYWQTTSISYFTSFFTIFLTIALLFSKYRLQKHSISVIIIAGLSIIYSSGMEEPFLITNILIVLCFIFYTKSTNIFKVQYYLLLIIALVTLLPAIMSKGNAARMALYPESGKFIFSIFYGALYGTRAILQNIIDPYIWASILLFSPWFIQLYKELNLNLLKTKTKIVYILATLLNLYAIPAVHYYGTGNRPVQRIMCLWYIFFFIGIFSLALIYAPQIEYLYNSFKAKFLNISGKVISPIRFLLLLSLLSFICINNPAKAVYDLIYNIPGYLQEIENMNSSIKQQQQDKNPGVVLQLNEFNSQPILLKTPLTVDYGISKYYGFKALKIIDPKNNEKEY